MTNKITIQDIYASHAGYVSDKWDIYLSEYNRLFQTLADSPIRLLEVGIQNGGSLEIWSQFFSNAELIVGCDINKDCAKLSYEDSRIKLVIGDINNTNTRREIDTHSSEFDIIIDDGSHTSSDIVETFLHLFSHLKYAGLYVVEDLHCSYWRSFEGGLFAPKSSMNFLKSLADIVNYEHWGIATSRTRFLSEFNIPQTSEHDKLLSEIHSVEFVNSMCTITRRPASENVLGIRHVIGVDQLVVSNKYAHETYSTPKPQDIQTPESSSKRSLGDDSYVRSLLLRIEELESALELTRNENNSSQ